MLFADNVPLDQEVELKREAERRGLLCMGPDCGTVLLGGLPLGFANAVRRGRIGLVGASGTGLQAVSCAIHALGEGVAHALGSGGRDLSAEVGGITTRQAIRALAADPSVEVLAVIAKPGDPAVESSVLDELAATDKPAVVHFMGRAEAPSDLPSRVRWAADLAETARAAVALARGESAQPGDDSDLVEREAREVAAESGGGHLAGLFVGGTLAGEAGQLLQRALGHQSGPPAWHAGAGEVARVGPHLILDLGDDAYTRGRPHPIIDPTARDAAILRAAEAGAGLLLLDLVLGFGAHPDPAGALAPVLTEAHARAERAGRGLATVVGLVGTDADPQPLAEQRARLRAAGAHAYGSPTLAARIAARAVSI
jgi:succinyl-CoA synthetase alpha subunit